jgi:predicted alpha/beta hydrolase family esterase
MNVFIFHGTMGSPESNWFPWLKKELENLGIEVFVPKFPTPEGQSLESWLKAFGPYQKYVNQDSVFVGHSMGPALIWRLLEQRTSPIKAAILVAPFDDLLDLPDFDKLVGSFVNKPFDWEKIKKNCPKFTVFASDNDPYILFKQTERIVKNLGTELKLIKGGKHLNAEAGYWEFPAVLAAIS